MIVAVPFPLSVKLTPEGRVPVSLRARVGPPGYPVAVTVKSGEPPPAGKVTVLALVMAGAWSTTSVKACVAFGETPLEAVIVIG